MVMSTRDGLNLADANLGQQVQDLPGPEINQEGAMPVLENINVAGVTEHVKVGRNLCQPALRREMHGGGRTHRHLLRSRRCSRQLSGHQSRAGVAQKVPPAHIQFS